MGKAACQTCRARHLDCDNAEPVCRQCRENGRTCVPAFNVRFRKQRDVAAADSGYHAQGKLSFGQDQVWVEYPKNCFIDETRKLVVRREPRRRCNARRTSSASRAAMSKLSDVGEDEASAESPAANIQPCESRDSLVTERAAASGAETPRSELSITSPVREMLASNTPLTYLSSSASQPSPLSPATDRSTTFTHGQDALQLFSSTPGLFHRHWMDLLYYFRLSIGCVWVSRLPIQKVIAEHLRKQFDITDPGFTREALQLAPSCPLLLYSMLATACIHQSRSSTNESTQRASEAEAENFHGQCVSILLPMLSNKHAITNGAFLACSTILRFYEEIAAPFHGRDDARHLLGGYASIAEYQERELKMDQLGEAAYWVHQRQDIAVAIINHRPTKGTSSTVTFDDSWSAADGYTWTKRATCLHAEVVAFCFDRPPDSVQVFNDLADRLNEWDKHKPETFSPVNCHPESSNSEVFPDLCFALDFCVLALSYHCFSMLLMAIHDPCVPKMGPDYLNHQTNLKNTVMYYLRLLCGLACSNPVPPARVVTCLAIAQCSAWVTEPIEQSAILELLRLVDREDVWPTSDIQEMLNKQWY